MNFVKYREQLTQAIQKRPGTTELALHSTKVIYHWQDSYVYS
jgi:hypothetical protein